MKPRMNTDEIGSLRTGSFHPCFSALIRGQFSNLLCVLCASAVFVLSGCARDRAAIVPILMYHHVQDLPPNADEGMRTWTVSEKDFRAQIKFLAEHEYHTITFDQLADNLIDGKPLPPKPIILTFDDGWDVQYGTVFPILRELHLTGTFFVCPSSIGETPGSGYMTWPWLREMIAGGMDVQSHTVNHPRLRDMPPDAQRREMIESKRTLESKLGRPIHAVAYPFGQFDQRIMKIVEEAGYRCAVGIEPGYVQRASQIYQLRRTRISYGDTLDTFREWVTYP